MSEAERERWNARYAAGAYEDRTHPTALLVEWLDRLPNGRALDVACGAGRNALFLAAAGYRVDAIDISSVALERAKRSASAANLSGIEWHEADLEKGPLPPGPFDVIVLVRYVHHPLMPRLQERLADGGYLLCEQHLTTHLDVVGPREPAFRMQPNQLLAAAKGLRVLFYREGIVQDPDGRPAALAQLVACRGAAGF